MSNTFMFTVKVTGIDLDAWAEEFGVARELAGPDFAQSAADHLTGGLEHYLHTLGYNAADVEVTEAIT